MAFTISCFGCDWTCPYHPHVPDMYKEPCTCGHSAQDHKHTAVVKHEDWERYRPGGWDEADGGFVTMKSRWVLELTADSKCAKCACTCYLNGSMAKIIDMNEYKVRKGWLAPPDEPQQSTATSPDDVVSKFLQADALQNLFVTTTIKRPQ